MRALVTGGAGFIGSHVADELHSSGYEVGILDDFSSGAVENLADLKGHFVLHKGSITDREYVKKTVKGYDVVLHHAAMVSVPRSIEDPVSANQLNVDGTLNVLAAASDAGVQRFVFASSASVYGDGPDSPIPETAPLSPLSPYAASKLSGESYCRVFATVYGLKTVSLRYFNVFGSRQKSGQYSGAIAAFMDEIKQGSPPQIFGSGLQTRDFVHVKDVARANLLSISQPVRGGEVFNVGTGVPTTVNHLAQTIARLLGRPDMEPIHLPERTGDLKYSVADITKISRDLGYTPAFTLGAGLDEIRGTRIWS